MKDLEKSSGIEETDWQTVPKTHNELKNETPKVWSKEITELEKKSGNGLTTSHRKLI